MRSIKESQQMMDIDKSSQDNQILVIKGGQRKKYGGQYGKICNQDILVMSNFIIVKNFITYWLNVQNSSSLCEKSRIVLLLKMWLLMMMI